MRVGFHNEAPPSTSDGGDRDAAPPSAEDDGGGGGADDHFPKARHGKPSDGEGSDASVELDVEERMTYVH